MLKPAILSKSASILCFHNHPSNDSSPSPEDIAVTKRLVEAGEIIGIEVIDHFVVCKTCWGTLIFQEVIDQHFSITKSSGGITDMLKF